MYPLDWPRYYRVLFLPSLVPKLLRFHERETTTPALDFTLAATTSGHEVRMGSGRPLVLVFHAQNAAFAVDRLNHEVREQYRLCTKSRGGHYRR